MRPIPVDIIPSHIYLSQEDQAALFGIGHPMTIIEERTQAGQFVYEETVEVFGKLKRSLRLRVLGPNWERSVVEITPTEAMFLGLTPIAAKTGDLSGAEPCRLVGPEGEVKIASAVTAPRPHLLCSPEEAADMHISNGQTISVDLISDQPKMIENIIVRVHPTFRLRIELHQDYARDFWITRPVHARVRD
ncbi:MAG: PduL/EutD family phosphate acyltransferase [bacterium]